jgi:hypothetical protein
MTEKTSKFMKYLKECKKMDIRNIDNYRYDILYKKNKIAIILCEDGNDYIYLIFDINRYFKEQSFNVKGYYNTHVLDDKIQCINDIQNKINIKKIIYKKN